nr:hypothetical protein Iba_chr05cCG14660 [Ipomoea batatas]
MKGLCLRIQGKNGAEIHGNHILCGASHDLLNNYSVCLLGWVEGIPECILISIPAQFLVFGDEMADIMWEIELLRPGGVGCEIVVVHKIIASHGDENQSLVHELSGAVSSDLRTQTVLIFAEVMQLFRHSDYTFLQFKYLRHC